MPSPPVPRLELHQICKRYPAVLANDSISLTVMPGDIHAILGENGAGKSTLMKIIYGAVRPDSGVIQVDGLVKQIRNPQEARAMGISMVFQHFSLFDTLTVAENIWLGIDKRQPLAQIIDGIVGKAAEHGLALEPMRPVHTLSVGERQRVEIVRALLCEPRLLILDEPTSVLTPQAVDKLFETLRKLAATGCSILYISHKLDEIRALCSACTVLRGGRKTGAVDPRQESNASLSQLMIGTQPAILQHRQAPKGALALSVEHLSLPRQDSFGTALEAINLQLFQGEILGIAGVSGNGQKELLACLSGEDKRNLRNAVRLMGVPAEAKNPAQRRQAGLHFIPEERLGRGAVPTMSLAENVLLTRSEGISQSGHARGWVGGLINWPRVRQQASELIAAFHVKANGPLASAKSLSGGNLQKFIVGREIDARPKVLIVSQPTWGVDVGAAAQIRAELLTLREQGCAILLVSEELEELFEMSDRLQVLAKGRLSPSVDRADATVNLIGQWMSGLWSEAEPNAKRAVEAANYA
jgi:general nucleoside transport system ATP-binding protein